MGQEKAARNLTVRKDKIEDAGLLVWDLTQNLLYADRTVAKLFGLDAQRAGNGLPIDEYVARVHIDDRPAFVQALSAAIVADQQQHEVYRVNSVAENYRYVVGFGRTFRDKSGSPILYSGIVVPASSMERNTAVRTSLVS